MLLMRVADICSVLAGGVIFEMELFVNMSSRNLFTPDICLYLIKFKLKPPKASLVSSTTLLRVFHNIVIELKVLRPRVFINCP